MSPMKISCVNEVLGAEWSDLIGQQVLDILITGSF